MLDKHLIAKTLPVAYADNIILWNDYRVTVLQDRLFRLEKSERKIFRDDATQTVWFRNMPPQTFTAQKEKDKLTVDTDSCRLVIYQNREDCYVECNGQKCKLSNERNLLGTYRTLDGYDGDTRRIDGYGDGTHPGKSEKVKLGIGVCSRQGVAVLDDSESLTLSQDGEVKAAKADGLDEYVFVYGDDYRAAVKALYLITGNVPMLPRFALGNWWSRYHKYTDKEYLQLMEKFIEHDIPLTVATVDMDWHYSVKKEIEERFEIEKRGRNTPFYGSARGWTGYSWDKNRFPDYHDFLKKIQERNLKITLNLHPADGVAWWEDAYKDMAKAMGMNPEEGEVVRFDIADVTFINNYFKILHKPYEKEGVDFWWIDWQQGTKSDMVGLDPLWALNHYHYLDSASNHETPLILSRYSGVGSHRYPLGFSGDTAITWKTLDYLPYFTATATNIGYVWWSHDIGGHHQGATNGELYARHVQYGVFSPINRLHCTDMRAMTKEPWAYGAAGLVAEKYLRFRHKLIPYLYTAAYRTHIEGRALVEPLYYEWKEEKAYLYDRQYIFGQSLIVAPVTTEAESDGYTRVKAWLPQGKWTDIFTGFVYEIGKGGKEITFLRKIDEIPVLARAGAVLPLSADKGNGCGNPEYLDLWAFSGDGEYTLYEDGLFTKIQQNGVNGVQTLTLTAEGDFSRLPDKRIVTVYFKDIPDGDVSLYINGKRAQTEELYKECAAVRFAFQKDTQYRIQVKYTPFDEKEKRTKHAQTVLLGAEGGFFAKAEDIRSIEKVETETEYVQAVDNADLSEGGQTPIERNFVIETLFR